MAMRYLVALLLLITAVACSTPGTADQPPTAGATALHDTPPAAAGPGAPQPEPPAPAPAPGENAEQIAARLAASIPTVRLSIVYTAQSDPNQLLGTPDSYLSKASFVDTRIDPAQADDTETGSIELGGSVEVFADENDARARKQYLDSTIAELPIDVSEYSYVRGPVLLRLSRHLTPEQAAEYDAVLAAS